MKFSSNAKYDTKTNQSRTQLTLPTFEHQGHLHYWKCLTMWQMTKNNCKIVIDNCAPCNISIDQNDVLATLDLKTGDRIPMEGSVNSNDIIDIHLKLPKVPKMSLREEIETKAMVNLAKKLKKKTWTLFSTTSLNKFYLGIAKNLTHKIHLNVNSSMYQKLFKIPPIFVQFRNKIRGLRTVQDFSELNNHSFFADHLMKKSQNASATLEEQIQPNFRCWMLLWVSGKCNSTQSRKT